jgi:site-specific recombinase XerD
MTAFKFWWWWSEHTHYREKLGSHPKCVTVSEARQFAAYLREETNHRWGIKTKQPHLSQASIDSYGRTTKVFFSWLEQQGFISATPFNASVRFYNKHKPDRIIKVLEPEKVNQILFALSQPARLETFTGTRDLAIFTLLIDSGIRLGELLSITFGDLELKNNRVKVRGKTGQRYAMFGDICRTAISGYLKFPHIKALSSSNFLWLTPEGNQLTENGFQSLIKRVIKASGVHFHAHQLRHTFASMMAAQGVNVFDLKELMGHSSITTTEIYVKLNADHLSSVLLPYRKEVLVGSR